MLRPLVLLPSLFCLLFGTSPAWAKLSTLRVVSFNTAMGLGAKWRGSASLRRLLQEERALAGAHLLALQEVCLNRPGQLSLYLEVMRASHGAYYHYADYASYNLGRGCDKGQAIVSAYPILGAGTLVLPTVGAHRVAVWVDLEAREPGYDRMRVYSVHLSNREGKNHAPQARRAFQARPVVKHALAFMRQHPGAPVIVAGDFNSMGSLSDPWRREPVIESMLEYFQASLPSYTPTFILPYQLDWVFYVNLHLIRSQAVGALYSDHLPVVADFALGEGKQTRE